MHKLHTQLILWIIGSNLTVWRRPPGDHPLPTQFEAMSEDKIPEPDPTENVWGIKVPRGNPDIPAAENGEPENVFLDYANAPGEPLSWSESLEDIIGPEEEEGM
jgi:hypothetical protein